MENKTQITPPRIAAFIEKIIKEIPKSPNSKETVDQLRSMKIHSIFTLYMSWKIRFIPQRPRKVLLWHHGIGLENFPMIDDGVTCLLDKVRNGIDINDHLSTLVKRIGYTLKKQNFAEPCDAGKSDKDDILIRLGLYHFHVGNPTAGNPKMRSNYVIFAHVTNDNFTIVSMCNHDVFDTETGEFVIFRDNCERYIESKMPNGGLYIHNPVTVSGHSDDISDHALYCVHAIREIDTKLDNNDYVKFLIEKLPVKEIRRPVFEWAFDRIDLCLLERKSKTYIPQLKFNKNE